MFGKAWSAVKQHPYMAVAGVVLGVLILLYIRRSSATAPELPNGTAVVMGGGLDGGSAMNSEMMNMQLASKQIDAALIAQDKASQTQITLAQIMGMFSSENNNLLVGLEREKIDAGKYVSSLNYNLAKDNINAEITAKTLDTSVLMRNLDEMHYNTLTQGNLAYLNAQNTADQNRFLANTLGNLAYMNMGR